MTARSTKLQTPAWAAEMAERHLGERHGWTIEFSSRKLRSRYADCNYGRRRIRVFNALAGDERGEPVERSMAHEIAHVLAYRQRRDSHHGWTFKSALATVEHAGTALVSEHSSYGFEGCRDHRCSLRTVRVERVRSWHVGQRVQFDTNDGELVRGVVVRVNARTLSVEPDGAYRGQYWRIGYNFARPDTDEPVAVVEPPRQTATVRPWDELIAADDARRAERAEREQQPTTGCTGRHKWVVTREVETGRSASGRAVYTERDQRCARCGLEQAGVKWSRTVR